MKKGFTMIELIFVIVILGILASVAIPRLAGTRADAEISAAIANLRTLLSDVSTYYITNGGIEDTTKFSAVTGVKLKNNDVAMSTGTVLQVGGKDCIYVKFEKKVDGSKVPASIALSKTGTDTLCETVAGTNSAVAAEFMQPIVDSDGTAQTGKTGVPVGPTAEVYPTTTGGNQQQQQTPAQ